jgi:hypothetical protein
MRSLNRLAAKLSVRLRAKRLRRFLSLMDVQPGDRILDVGGLPGIWLGSGFEHRVTLLNLTIPDSASGPFTWAAGNGCAMPQFADKSFDIVFSNSVIEHVGDRSAQQAMADEVRRIGRRYWVQTPNRHFPIEVHFLFPFFQYMPPPMRRAIARIWPFSFAKLYHMDPVEEADHIWLLDRKSMSELFPDSMILRERFAGMVKSLVAYKT